MDKINEKRMCCLNEIIEEIKRAHPELMDNDLMTVIKGDSEESILNVIKENHWDIVPEFNEIFQSERIDFNDLYCSVEFRFICFNEIECFISSDLKLILEEADDETFLDTVKELDPDCYNETEIKLMFTSDKSSLRKSVLEKLEGLSLDKAYELEAELNFEKYVKETSESIMDITNNIINNYY
ncbi:hypothetical protein AAGG74_17085 [Bacillus mexicanus]|uniref:hypothetical protein n=1 Tax=Bacillus mexicanus TaxID=2834415 RepID=UPI003D2352FF